MSTTVKRIKRYLDVKRINNRKFEESIGFSNGAFSSQYKNNRSIGVDKVEKILQVYSDLNPVWLLTGREQMLLNPSYDVNESSNGVRLSEPEFTYGKENEYKEKYIKCLEDENKALKEELKQKQEIINGFLSGAIHKME